MAYFVAADVALYALSARLQLAQIARTANARYRLSRNWFSRFCFPLMHLMLPVIRGFGFRFGCAGLTRLIAVNVEQLGAGGWELRASQLGSWKVNKKNGLFRGDNGAL